MSALACTCKCHDVIVEDTTGVGRYRCPGPLFTDATAAMEACPFCFPVHDLALHAHGYSTTYRPAHAHRREH